MSARPSKKAAIVALLERPASAAISDLTKTTGWQIHSVRAALTGLRKEGREGTGPRQGRGRGHASQARGQCVDMSRTHQDRGPSSGRDRQSDGSISMTSPYHAMHSGPPPLRAERVSIGLLLEMTFCTQKHCRGCFNSRSKPTRNGRA